MAETLAEFGVLTPSGFRADLTASDSHRRLLDVGTVRELDLQLKAETLAALHQIRRLLFWILVVVPAVLIAIGVAVVSALIR